MTADELVKNSLKKGTLLLKKGARPRKIVRFRLLLCMSTPWSEHPNFAFFFRSIALLLIKYADSTINELSWSDIFCLTVWQAPDGLTKLKSIISKNTNNSKANSSRTATKTTQFGRRRLSLVQQLSQKRQRKSEYAFLTVYFFFFSSLLSVSLVLFLYCFPSG